MEKGGIPFRGELVFADHPEIFDPMTGSEAVRWAFDRGTEFDGFAAPSDGQAATAINELMRRGIKVPHQLDCECLQEIRTRRRQSGRRHFTGFHLAGYFLPHVGMTRGISRGNTFE